MSPKRSKKTSISGRASQVYQEAQLKRNKRSQNQQSRKQSAFENDQSATRLKKTEWSFANFKIQKKCWHCLKQNKTNDVEETDRRRSFPKQVIVGCSNSYKS